MGVGFFHISDFFHCDENLATSSLREEGFILGQKGSFSHGKEDRTPVREAMAVGAEGQLGHTAYPVRKKRLMDDIAQAIVPFYSCPGFDEYLAYMEAGKWVLLDLRIQVDLIGDKVASSLPKHHALHTFENMVTSWAKHRGSKKFWISVGTVQKSTRVPR